MQSQTAGIDRREPPQCYNGQESSLECLTKRGYGALYIEMKRTQGGAVSAAQEIWIRMLNKAGNKAVVCKGFSEAKDEILKYLEVE
jgi:hypothetical protein